MNLVKANGMELVIDEYSIGHAPKDPNYTYINLFCSEANIRSVDVEAMFTNLKDGIELYDIGMSPVRLPDGPYISRINIPKFTDDFTMYKEGFRYVIRLVKESDMSKEVKEIGKEAENMLEALVTVHETCGV